MFGHFLSIYTNFHKKLCIYAIIYKLIIEFVRQYCYNISVYKKFDRSCNKCNGSFTGAVGVMTIIEDRGTYIGKRW